MTTPTLGQRRAALYACEVQGDKLVLIRFIWTEARDDWVRHRPKRRFVVSDVMKFGADDYLRPLEGSERL